MKRSNSQAERLFFNLKPETGNRLLRLNPLNASLRADQPLVGLTE